MNRRESEGAGKNSDVLTKKDVPLNELLYAGLQALYHILYCAGSRIIRYSRRSGRRVKKGLLHCKWFLKRKLYDMGDQFSTRHSGGLAFHLRNNVWLPLQESGQNLRELSREPQTTAERYGSFHKALSHALSPGGRVLARLFNVLLPICGVVALVVTIQYFSALTYALRVEYNGEYIGYVRNEGEFSAAEKEVQTRLVNEVYLPPKDGTPIYTMEVVNPEQLSDQGILVNNIIQASGNQFQEATGLYVDNKFVGAVADGNQLLMSLKLMRDEARSEEADATEVSFVEAVKVEQGLYPVSSVAVLEDVSMKLTSEVAGERIYLIEEGDSPSLIADKVGVPTKTLLALNPEVSKTMLIGDKFIVSKAVPFLQKKVVKTVTEQVEVAFTTDTEYDKSKDKSYNKVVREGSAGLTEVTSQIVSVDGYETERIVLSQNVITAPVNAKVVVGSLSSSVYNFSNSGASGGKKTGGYIWPVNGGHISCPIWGYSGHSGTDIAASSGTSIFAAKDGTVAYSGWSRSYGYNVLLNHADGTKTRYAHCSSLGVTVGQKVKQGSVIAYVGRTGNATGNHCHFEIIQNGNYLDARNYIGSRR